MKSNNYPGLLQRCYFLVLLFFLLSTSTFSQFQNLYGTSSSNSFSKVIPHGSSFYVLGSDNGQATITRIDQTGAWLWTRRLDILSNWTDGVVISGSGNLYVVGFTLPFNSNNKSLIGEITPNGTFLCIKSLEGPGNEALTRIKLNPGGTFAAVGFHTVNNLRDVVIYNLSSSCTVNSKRQFFNFVDDNFGNDLEVLPGSGDFMVAGSLGSNAIIYQMTSAGQFVAGAQGPALFNYADLARLGNGDILAAANAIANDPPRLIRFDNGLFPVWEVAVNGLTSLDQVVDGGNGNIYVVGTATINSLPRAVIVKINDSSGPPVLDWAKYLENGESGYTGGALAALSSGNLAFVDARDGHPNSLGQTDGFMAVTDGDLMSECTLDGFVFLTFENTPFDGPFEPELFDSEFPLEMMLGNQGLDYMSAQACAADPCTVDLIITQNDSCGMVQICAVATGPQPYNYLWCDSQSTQCIAAQLSCTPQTFCVSVTCADGSMATATQTFSAADNIPPVALCQPGFGVVLDANCEFSITPGMIDAGSTDNCQIQSMSVSPNLLNACGDFQVVLTVTDWCNNTSTCSTGIQAADFTPPTIMCPPNLTLGCDNDVSPNATGFATATDKCDPNPVISYSDVVFGMLPCDAVIQRTWTATDSCGNMDTCLQLINVMDNVPPVALCNSGISVYLGTPCTATVTTAMLDAGSTDNCQLQSLAVSPNVFTQCGTPLVTLTATDLCGNMDTCQQTVTVLDTVPPMITCPQDVITTAFFPDCEAVVNSIQPVATDNCTVQSINYSISGATSGNGGGDASGQLFQSGISTVTYTAMDGCGNIDSCSFNVTVECDTCACLGFTNLSFYNFLNLPDISVSCDSSPVVLPCIGPDALYAFQWTLLCSDPLCLQSMDYEIVSASGGPVLVAGTAIFPTFNFSYGQLAGPGNYQIILTGNCGGETCVCIVNFTVSECCECGTYSDMTYRPVPGVPNISAVCGDTLIAECLGSIPWTISGNFHCMGSSCPDSTQMFLMLTAPDGTISSDTIIADPGFNFVVPASSFDTTGCYNLTLKTVCGQDTCYCDFIVKVQCDTCCTDYEAFCEKIEQAVFITADSNMCKATVSIGDLGNCGDYIESIIWGDGEQDFGPFYSNDMPMHVYAGSGTYVISYLAVQLDGDELICFEKFLSDTIVLNCPVCPDNYIQNGDFSLGNPLGLEAISFANDWSGIWPVGPGTNRHGDYMGQSGVPNPVWPPCGGATSVPIPLSQGNYAGFTCWYSLFKQYRQGIMNELANPIFPNTGCYNFSVKIACPCLRPLLGDVRLAVYGVRDDAITFITPVTGFPNGPYSFIPGNGSLFWVPPFPGGGAKLLDKILVPKTCNNAYATYTFQFNSANLSAPIDRIFLTREDVPGGVAYLDIDDVCIEATACNMDCACGTIPFATIHQAGSGFSQSIQCNTSAPLVTLPCSLPGRDITISGFYSCNQTSCGSGIVNWVLTPQGGGNPISGTSVSSYPAFNITLPWSTFSQSGGTYALALSWACGTQSCGCTMNFTLPACPCECDPTFNSDVAQGFGVTQPTPVLSCTRNFKPVALCSTDAVQWSVSGVGTTWSSFGNNTQAISFPGPGVYQVCMIVTRTDPTGTICTFEKCQRVYVKCQLNPDDPEPKVSLCEFNSLANGDFRDTGLVAGRLLNGGLVPGWEVYPNEGEGFIHVEDSTGASDEGHLVFYGGHGNFAGVVQEINLVPDIFLNVAYQYKNYALDSLPVGTAIEVRLQKDPLPGSEYQVVDRQLVGNETSGGWEIKRTTIDFMLDTSMHYLVICVQNEDSTRLSVIGLDNIELCTSSTFTQLEEPASTASKYSLFPNPTTGELRLRAENILPKNAQLQVFDLLGRTIQKVMLPSGVKEYTFSLSDVPAGVYIVQIMEKGKSVWIGKVVKQ